MLAAAIRPDPASLLVSPALVDSTIKAAIQFVRGRTLVPGTASSLARGVLTSMYLHTMVESGFGSARSGSDRVWRRVAGSEGNALRRARDAGQVQAARADDVPATTVKRRQAECHGQ